MSQIRSRAATTPAMTAVWGDAAIITHALAFEAALAVAGARTGVVGKAEGDAIVRACATTRIDVAHLADEASLAGTLAIPLVRHLRNALAPHVAAAVHRGATSQDLADTVLSLQMRAGLSLLQADGGRICSALAVLAEAEAATPAIGRTLMQDAVPIALGLRFAQWHAGMADALRRLERAVDEGAVLQFGGAAGTRAGLSGEGAAMAAVMAVELGLPDASPWHARRGPIASIGAAVAETVGTVAKIARDVSLLSQNAVSEIREPMVTGRGGSSAMAHKRNPTGCQIALSASYRTPGLASALLAGLAAEEERGLGGWQMEASVMADLFTLAAGALDAMAVVAEGLVIDHARIASNLADADIGRDIGESVALIGSLLSQGNPRDAIRSR